MVSLGSEKKVFFSSFKCKAVAVKIMNNCVYRGTVTSNFFLKLILCTQFISHYLTK